MKETTSPLAGWPAPVDLLVNVPRLVTAYYSLTPDPDVAAQRVAFGTSGHRGSAFASAFNAVAHERRPVPVIPPAGAFA